MRIKRNMAKICATMLLVLLVATVNMMPKANAWHYVDSSPGGCPNLDACKDTCAPCYRGVGTVTANCMAPILDIWVCRCIFNDGASIPTDPPVCPKRPPHPTDAITANVTQ